jgi:hypothetical protein
MHTAFDQQSFHFLEAWVIGLRPAPLNFGRHVSAAVILVQKIGATFDEIRHLIPVTRQVKR